MATPVPELVRDATEHLRPDAAARGVALVVAAPTELPPAPVAPDRIVRVVVNLVENALQHTPSDGRVRVEVRGVPTAVVVEVAVTGTGIPPGDRDRVFEPFYRGGAVGARAARGAGLGLAIARAIVEGHGGRIELADPAVGACVRFTRPTGTASFRAS